MTIPTMKPSPKLLPRDAKILSKLPEQVDISYAMADQRDSRIFDVLATTDARAKHLQMAIIGISLEDFSEVFGD